MDYILIIKRCVICAAFSKKTVKQTLKPSLHKVAIDTFLLNKSSRSSHQRYSLRKGFLRNFAKFTGKHLCQRLFFNKVAGLRPKACNFIKKRVSGTVVFL